MEGWFSKARVRLPALALLAATVVFWSLYDRYEAAGPVLLQSPSLADGTIRRGDVGETGGVFTLAVRQHGDETAREGGEANPAGTSARIDFQLPAKARTYDRIRVSGRIRVESVVTGKYPWNCARLLLAQYDRDKKWIPVHHALFAADGSRDWFRHDDTFEVHPRADRLVVVLEQSGKSGLAQFRQIQAEPVQLRRSFNVWRGGFAIAWLFMAVLYFTRCRLHRRRLRVLILLNAVAIMAGTMMPGAWLTTGIEKSRTAIMDLRPSSAELIQPAGSEKAGPKPSSLQEQMDWLTEVEVEAHEAGHFFLFASLCFLVYLSAALERQSPTYFFKVGIDVLLFAAVTESLQFLTMDRVAGISDLKIDLYGMVLALLLFCLWLPLVRRHQAKRA